MARLEILKGVNAGKDFSFGHEVSVGRSADNIICLPDRWVSRRHARVVRQGTCYVIEDLDSTHGTVLRGGRIPPLTPYQLEDGDEIVIGSTRLIFHLDTAAPGLPEQASAPFLPAPGSFSLTMLDDSASNSEISAVLDASTIMQEVKRSAEHSGAGVQELLGRLQTMYQVSTALGATTDRDELMGKILACIFDIFPHVERAFIVLREEGAALVPVAVKNRQAASEHDATIAISHTILNEVMSHRHSVLSFDALQDDRFRQQESIINFSIRSVMCVPLLIENEVLGFIQVDTCTGAQGFATADLELLTGIGAQAAIAVKNAQLYKAVEAEVARRITLQRYFSPNLVELLMSGPATDLSGKAYSGTVLFSDIIGFTAMSEVMSPADVVVRLNRYFTIMQKLIYDNGGNVDKFGGDDIMAFWGVPHAEQHHMHDAVLTAIQMQAKLWPFNLVLLAEGQRPVYMGIGLNSGEFVAGNIGSEDRVEFTVIGDTVNVAARIVKLAGRYQVFISAVTWEAIRHMVCAVRLPPVKFKGKSQPMTLYSIRAVQDASLVASVLTLPCAIRDPHGEVSGQGILTGARGAGEALRLFLNTDMALRRGLRLTVQPALTEYHETIELTGTVETCLLVTPEDSPPYTTAVLAAIEGDMARSFFMPGSCLVTAHTWEHFERQ